MSYRYRYRISLLRGFHFDALAREEPTLEEVEAATLWVYDGGNGVEWVETIEEASVFANPGEYVQELHARLSRGHLEGTGLEDGDPFSLVLVRED